MKNYRISVHIPFYVDSNFKKKKILLNKVCKSYLQLSTKLKVFVHTNKITKKNSKRVNFILHDFKNDHPYKLTWKCRNLMFLQRNDYDFFIFGEDDIVFSKNNFKYWLKYKNDCIKNNFNLGFLRVEINKKNNLLYTSDQISKIKYYVKIANKKFAKLENSYCAFWIYDKNEFKKFIKTKYWNFYWKWITISGILLTREMAAVGWHGEDMNGQFMNRYKASIIPISNHNLEKNSFIRHISNRYANAPAGLFGTLKVNEILSDNLKNFKPHNFFSRSLKRLKFLLYRLVRFNIKNYIRI